jgi:hypothetical protein
MVHGWNGVTLSEILSRNKCSAPDAMRARFEYYRAFNEDAEQNKALINKSKLQIPVLVLAGDYYSVFGKIVKILAPEANL